MTGRISRNTVILILLAILVAEGIWMLWNMRRDTTPIPVKAGTSVPADKSNPMNDIQQNTGPVDAFPFPDQQNQNSYTNPGNNYYPDNRIPPDPRFSPQGQIPYQQGQNQYPPATPDNRRQPSPVFNEGP